MPDELLLAGYTASEEAEYQALIARMDEEFPPVSKAGFDFSRIIGNCRGRTAKAIILHLSCHGWSIAQIADTLQTSPASVSRYLTAAMREASPVDDVETLRQFELRKLDEQERACWEQFERSCQDEMSETRTYGVDEDADDAASGEVVKRTRKGQSGNPAYIRILQEISRRRAALVGMDRPAKVEIDKTERKLVVSEIIVKSREDALAARAAGLLK